MNKQKLFAWLTRVFAFVGILAMIFLIVNTLKQNIVATTSYPSFGGTMELKSESVSYDSVRSIGAPELLRDENTNTEQKVIKTGSLSLTVDDAISSAQNIRTMIEEEKGFVQTSSINELEDGTHYGYVTVRVPSSAFEESMAALKKMAVVVEAESVSASDITEQYIDLSARLKNAKAQEARYIEILETAKTVDEILQIETALSNTRGYIESLTGQIQYLDSQTEMSSITITLSEEPVVKIGGKTFRPWTSVKQAAQTVVSIAQWLVVAIIWIVIIGACIGAPVVLILWVGWKIAKRRKVGARK
jgi:hypothetical protein